MCGQRWSGADEIELLSRWGSEPLSKTANKLRRTKKACTSKMDRMVGSNATDRGRHTLSSVAESSGYHRDTISAAVRAMGLRRVVKSDGGQWLLTDEQVGKQHPTVVRELWGMLLERLKACGALAHSTESALPATPEYLETLRTLGYVDDG